jgi:hypothetical protein
VSLELYGFCNVSASAAETQGPARRHWHGCAPCRTEAPISRCRSRPTVLAVLAWSSHLFPVAIPHSLHCLELVWVQIQHADNYENRCIPGSNAVVAGSEHHGGR